VSWKEESLGEIKEREKLTHSVSAFYIDESSRRPKNTRS
jgi:hypothetical protein